MDRKTMLEMYEEGVEPLLISVCKWYDLAYGNPKKGVIIEGDTCALCHQSDYDCEDCPIAEDTDYDCCENTPFEELMQHIRDDHGFLKGMAKFDTNCETCRELARDEFDYLVGLLYDQRNEDETANHDMEFVKEELAILEDDLNEALDKVETARDAVIDLRVDIGDDDEDDDDYF